MWVRGGRFPLPIDTADIGDSRRKGAPVDLKEDTRLVREEFDAISTPTQVFIATLVCLGVLVGLVLARAIGFGVDEADRPGDCITFRDKVYCAEGAQE